MRPPKLTTPKLPAIKLQRPSVPKLPSLNAVQPPKASAATRGKYVPLAAMLRPKRGNPLGRKKLTPFMGGPLA